MLIRSSTKVLVAGPLSPDLLSPVARVSGTPLTVNVVVALPVTLPAVGEVKVTWNWPLALVVPENGPAGLGAAPLLGVSVTVTGALEAEDDTPSIYFVTVTVKVCG